MPLYEYACPSDHRLEVLEPHRTLNQHICNECHNPEHTFMYRIVSPPARAVLTKDCTGAQRH